MFELALRPALPTGLTLFLGFFLAAGAGASTLIVEKQTLPDGAPGSFTFSGNASGTVSDDGQITVGGLSPGTYTVTEADPNPAFSLSDISCDDGNSSGDVGTRTATFQLEAGETVTCTFTNTMESTLTFRVSAFPPYETMTAGVAPAPGLFDAPGGEHTITDATTLWTTMGPPVVNPLTGWSLSATLTNLMGSFTSMFSTPNPVGLGVLCPGGCLGGPESLSASVRVGTPATKANLAAPNVLGAVPAGGTVMDMMPLLGGTVTLTGAPFVTGMATITGIRSTFVTIPARGGAFGLPLTLKPTPGEALVKQFTPMGLTSTTMTVTVSGTNNLISAAGGGHVSLVSPLRINSNLGRQLAGVVTKKFVFVPEPTMPLLLGGGVAALVALGRKRMRS